MKNVMVGVLTAAVWFALSYAAHAERVCKQVCDHGTCVSRCVDRPDADVTVHEHDRGPPPVELQGPGVGVQIGR